MTHISGNTDNTILLLLLLMMHAAVSIVLRVLFMLQTKKRSCFSIGLNEEMRNNLIAAGTKDLQSHSLQQVWDSLLLRGTCTGDGGCSPRWPSV